MTPAAPYRYAAPKPPPSWRQRALTLLSLHGGMLLGCLLGLVSWACTPKPKAPQVDALAALQASVSAAGLVVNTATATVLGQLEARLRAERQDCRVQGAQGDALTACYARAEGSVLAAFEKPLARVRTAAEVQRLAADAIDAALACRREHTACEEEKRQVVVSALAKLADTLSEAKGSSP